MSVTKEFLIERERRISDYADDNAFQAASKAWLVASMHRKYVYNFEWLGRPIIQYPQDIVAIQELVWTVKPDLIIETGIAHGGSLILSASLLALLDLCEGSLEGRPSRRVIGIDVDIREHNRWAIESHPLSSRISMIQGSSVAESVIASVRTEAASYDHIMVLLDSMHTHDHVLAELHAYAPLVSQGSYCIVFDTFIEDMPKGFFSDRPWDVGDNPKTAVREFLQTHPEFHVDTSMERKLQVTAASEGFLRRSK